VRRTDGIEAIIKFNRFFSICAFLSANVLKFTLYLCVLARKRRTIYHAVLLKDCKFSLLLLCKKPMLSVAKSTLLEKNPVGDVSRPTLNRHM